MDNIRDCIPKYSIITPVYNSFALMDRYFASLENQSFQNFEVILVDDCSSDGSYEKLCTYATQSPLRLVIKRAERNMGPGNARNIGMDAARGEWITFADSDDWISTDMLQKIDAVAAMGEYNCIVFDYCITDGKKEKECRSLYYGEPGSIDVSSGIKYIRNHAIGKVYKAERCRLAGVRYPQLRRCEDVAFVARAIEACGTICYMRESLYYYYQRRNSLSNNSAIDEEDMVKAFSVLEEAFAEKYPCELMEKSITDVLYGALLMMCKAGKSRKYILDYIDRYEKKYPGWSECEILHHIGKAKSVFLFAVRKRLIGTMKYIALCHTLLIG